MIKFIAETAFSHEGNFDYLLKQIKLAKEANADFVKFQVLLNKDDYIIKSHPVYMTIDKWLFSKTQWKEAFRLAKSLNLKILVLPANKSSTEFCLKLDNLIDLYEVHSVCFNDIHLINLLKSTNKKIILGIGGRTGPEVETLINRLQKPLSEIILMFGFQSFPTDKSKLQLKKIKTFKTKYSIIMGFADHSTYENEEYIFLNSLAYIYGAIYFEKHIVLKKGEKRIDYESAIAKEEFLLMRSKLNELETVLGDGELDVLNDKELVYKNREKQVVYSKDLEKGHILCVDDFCYKITNMRSDILDILGYEIINKTLIVNVKREQSIENIHLI